MPRVRGGVRRPGLRVPGVYAALLARERKRHGRAQLAGRRRPRHLLVALEAGASVVVRGHDLGGRDIPAVPLSAEQKQWPNWYSVTPDDGVELAESPVVDPIAPADVVKPSDREIPWYGCAVDHRNDGLKEGVKR